MESNAPGVISDMQEAEKYVASFIEQTQKAKIVDPDVSEAVIFARDGAIFVGAKDEPNKLSKFTLPCKEDDIHSELVAIGCF